MNLKHYFLVTVLLLVILVELSDENIRKKRIRRRRRRKNKIPKLKTNRSMGRRGWHRLHKNEEYTTTTTTTTITITSTTSTARPLIEPDIKFHLPGQFCSCARSKPEYHEEWEMKHRNRRKREVNMADRVRRSVSANGRDRIVGGYSAAHNKVLSNQ